MYKRQNLKSGESSSMLTQQVARIIVDMKKEIVMWINTLSIKTRLYNTIIPYVIIIGTNSDYHKHCRVYFGQYTQKI